MNKPLEDRSNRSVNHQTNGFESVRHHIVGLAVRHDNSGENPVKLLIAVVRAAA
jgi:hypothetical protein